MKALSGNDITSSMATQSSGGDELRRPLSREDAAPPRSDRGKTTRWEKWNDCSERWGRLMLAARGGDGTAYEQLLRELDLWLRAYYARRLPYPAADDARQEVLLAIHAKRHTFAPSKPFGAWVTAIARYKWVDRVRDASRYSTLALDDEIAVDDHEGAALSAAALDQLLGRLKPAQESVIRLVKLNGLSIARASGATGQSAALVKINIHRGLKKLATFVS
ncbi:RNA polymerase subunit sigma-24 [Bradyrhizobium liaoningense]|uniref:sigma factor-like helix-turn-helix DNA-binding protein n=1 Tax=Bradyrhizobium liaoningense TaxID=43992 RepID=UPI001BABDF1C|nr:sigma factor-like helix-turn-helix DNA-binding protein [Bradyrhizobium liaoningense]MBR0843547.1 RNA polymerase subunit sigma-24 [Bradyrhizobium liaoningense]